MFDVGFWELSLLAVLALIILGPDRLPRVAHTTGVWLGRARSAVRKLQREIQRELMIEETRAAVEQARETFDQAAGTIHPDPPAPDDPHARASASVPAASGSMRAPRVGDGTDATEDAAVRASASEVKAGVQVPVADATQSRSDKQSDPADAPSITDKGPSAKLADRKSDGDT